MAKVDGTVQVAGEAARWLGLACAAWALGACTTTAYDAKRELSHLSQGSTVLVGRVQLKSHGLDETAGSTLEAEGARTSFQLGASGDVLWVIDRPRRDSVTHLTFVAPPYSDGALSLGEHVVLARGAASCSYFGVVTLEVSPVLSDRVALWDDRQQPIQTDDPVVMTGPFSGPRAQAERTAIVPLAVGDHEVTQKNDDQHLAALARAHPELATVTCERVAQAQ